MILTQKRTNTHAHSTHIILTHAHAHTHTHTHTNNLTHTHTGNATLAVKHQTQSSKHEMEFCESTLNHARSVALQGEPSSCPQRDPGAALRQVRFTKSTSGLRWQPPTYFPGCPLPACKNCMDTGVGLQVRVLPSYTNIPKKLLGLGQPPQTSLRQANA